MKILKYIIEHYKFDGIECHYTTFTKEQTEILLEICNEHNYYISGGSDYHGANKIGVDLGVGYGDLHIEELVINNWKDKVMSY